MNDDDFDVIIVGAGLSGIATAYYLQTELPALRFTLLEARDAIGGTWDLFRYPGVRSDSDMYTLGYSFRPWDSDLSIASGGAIRDYIRETARLYGIDRRIRFGHRLVAAQWSSVTARWTLTVRTADGHERALQCRFLQLCSGYYDYERGHDPGFAGEAEFRGTRVHAQHWPQDLQTEGRRIVVIGSGATAVTLVPELAKTAAHVTMLQRSPSYILAIPAVDVIARAARRLLPRRLAYRLVRKKNVLLGALLYRQARRHPQAVKAWLLKRAQRALPAGFDAATHLTPRYQPWDQRLCLVPDGDLFAALRSGRASIVTDRIERFVPEGVKLASGRVLEADIVVKATGLQLRLLGGATLTVDGQPVDLAQTLTYKGLMFSGVPNLASTFGYTNASWTLKCELIAQYVCRLLKHLQATGTDVCVPLPPAEAQRDAQPLIDLSSGYIQRDAAHLPRQGAHEPWRMHQNYGRDLQVLMKAPLEDGALRFLPRGTDAWFTPTRSASGTPLPCTAGTASSCPSSGRNG
jgi:cation diffusion facilitator CzcD-associated flavoprotein CzcO